MIHELFKQDRPRYIRFRQNKFQIGDKRREQLRGKITDLHPTRKLFEGKQILCWSNDSITSKNGQRCSLCRDRWTCTERIRLMLLLDNIEQTPTPAILEIGHGSFDALDTLIREVDQRNLAEQTIIISIKTHQGHLRFTFEKE